MFHLFRRFTQTLSFIFLFLVPFLDIFRIDIKENEFISLGKHYSFTTLNGIYLALGFVIFLSFFIILSYSKGRVFCGWSCPYGSTIEFFNVIRTVFGSGTNRWVYGFMNRSSMHRILAQTLCILFLFIAPIITALGLSAYLVNPSRILNTVLNLSTLNTEGVLLISWIFLFIVLTWICGFIVRFDFCRIVCIYGMGQSIIYSSNDQDSKLRPRFTSELSACGTCTACLNTCFVDLDPRSDSLVIGYGEGCFNCGDCVDICTVVQEHQGKDSLLTFRGNK